MSRGRRRPHKPAGPRPSAAQTPELPPYLRNLGVTVRKALGQHFLANEFLLADIAAACRLTPTDTVLEIGAGPGGLTEELARRAGCVVAVELDEELVALTRERLGERYPGLRIVAADVLEHSPIELLAEGGASAPYVATGNLPYYITQPVVRRLIDADPPPERIVVLVQREVAHRMVGGPGHESVLSLAIRCYGEASLLFDVPPTAFWPPPRVHSAVVRIERSATLPVDLLPEQLPRLMNLMRASFAEPRKQMHNSMGTSLGIGDAAAIAALRAAAIDPAARAQHLLMADWERLFRVVEAAHPEVLDV